MYIINNIIPAPILDPLAMVSYEIVDITNEPNESEAIVTSSGYETQGKHYRNYLFLTVQYEV